MYEAYLEKTEILFGRIFTIGTGSIITSQVIIFRTNMRRPKSNTNRDEQNQPRRGKNSNRKQQQLRKCSSTLSSLQQQCCVRGRAPPN
ncbi:hypothetical protein DdX_08072 [Ditylenchus destructor]|uniref:Uncharacterized protein n=1 Tax=Ditylenchus destructor TaxID=166010 RepID=A0AAD4N752_9BILA|nr:hypothetical protein DdX_08072 [Ditylenchus destructor]